MTRPLLAVTGATGFVGARFQDVAAGAGVQLRLLARRPVTVTRTASLVQGSLEDRDALGRLVEGADAVVHIAGAINAPTRDAFLAANAGGTLNLVEAALAAGVHRFVHVSSLAAREPALSDYGYSKARSEGVVAAAALDWTIVRPPAIYGPGDRETLALFKMAKRGLVVLPPPGRFSPLHVDGLARLLVALTATDGGLCETYEPDDGREGGWEHRDFAAALGNALGRRVRTVSASARLMAATARADRLLRGTKARLTPDRARYYAHPDWTVDPARRPPPALWQPPLPTPEGLAATAAWYREQGWL